MVKLNQCRTLICKLLVLLFVVSCFSAEVAHAYNYPDWVNNRADISRPKAHGLITQQAIRILRNDGYGAIADATEQNLQSIFDGLTQADRKWGSIRMDILGLFDAEWSKAANRHYYNPSSPERRKGLIIPELHVPDTFIYLFFWGDSNKAFALRGPQPDAARMADWYYALAVKAMREGRIEEAYRYLGEVIHLVQDLTVPQHATDSYGLHHHRHQDYESYADDYMLRPEYLAHSAAEAYHVPTGVYVSSYDEDSPDYIPTYYETRFWERRLMSHLVQGAALRSARHVDRVRCWHGNDFPGVNREMLPLAQKLTAGALFKFHTEWQTEPYSAIRLTVCRAEALDVGNQRIEPGTAELLVTLNMIDPPGSTTRTTNAHTYEDFLTGYFGDTNPVYPGSYLGYDVWTFPYTSGTVRRSEEVEMILALYDDDDIDAWTDGISGWPERAFQPHWLDLHPEGSQYRLWLKANLRTSEISLRWKDGSWRVIGRLGETITLQGTETKQDHAHGGRGRIDFSIEGIYLPAREPLPQPPERPVNRFPIQGSMGVSTTPLLLATPYLDLDGDAQRASEWRIWEVGVREYTVSGGPTNMYRITTPLGWGKTCGWQVRYQDATGRWSEWSAPTFFHTNNPPRRPVNRLPANGTRHVALTPRLVASAYSDPENQRHEISEWQVYKPGAMILDWSYRSPIAATSVDIPGGVLRPFTEYLWRVRYNDVMGAWSEWSDPTSFTTGGMVLQPAFDFGLSISPDAGTVIQGDSVQIVVDTNLISGTTQSVEFSCSGLPAGAACSFVPSSCSPTCSSNLTISTQAATPTATYSIAITGMGGNVTRTKTYTLTVNPPAPPPKRPTLTVTSPNGGERWFIGSVYNITWKSSGLEEINVSIDYSTDGGRTWIPIATNEPNDGSYAWTIPKTPSETAYVSVQASTPEFLVTDQSNNYFTILYGQD